MIIFNFIGTVYYYLTQVLVFGIGTPIAFILWIISTPFDRQRKVCHSFNAIIGQLIVNLNPYWKTTITGKENIDYKNNYVIASNHQSLADIVMLTYLRPLQFKYVSKKELLYIPFLGWIMAMAKYVLLNRKDPKSQFKMMRTCENHLNNGLSIAIFPEGTRTKNGELGRFKDGASLLSMKTKKPILPVCMVGNNNSMPKKGFIWNKRVNISIHILPPIFPSEYGKSKELTAAVRESIEKKLIQETI